MSHERELSRGYDKWPVAYAADLLLRQRERSESRDLLRCADFHDLPSAGTVTRVTSAKLRVAASDGDGRLLEGWTGRNVRAA